MSTNSGAKILDITKRDLFELYFPQSDEKYVKKVPCRLQRCLEPFSMLTMERCSETGFFRHLSILVFCSL